jgi:putative isomerase
VKREQWWSWNADLPAEMRHLPSGFVVTPVFYAASENRPSRLPPGEGVVFGRRPIGDEEIELGLSLAGTRLAWRYGMDGAGALTIEWRTEAFGEWGLRFWVLLCVHAEDGADFGYDRETGVLSGARGEHRLEVRAAKAPLLVTVHEDLEALEAELTDKGYFYLGSRGTEGRFVALRFNLEEAPEMRVEVRLGGAEAPRPALPEKAPDEAEAPRDLEPQDALDALHDVMSWNHVYDYVNGRPYTALSRFWNSYKFGGFGVWLDDVLYNAWLWGQVETERARDNLEAVFAWQTEAGNFPCLVTGNDAWLDRSQPPIASFVVWSLYQRTGDRDLLAHYYPGLLRNYRWWWARRRLGETGLVCYGTSLDAGDGLYKGTKLAAKDESTMDNSPLHDPVDFDEASGLLLAADVGVNSLLVLDGEVLAMMAGALGRGDERKELEAGVAAHKARIADWLWDEERQVFANRRPDGSFVAPLAPTSFYPLAAGIGSPGQVAALVARYLLPVEKFGGAPGLPSITRDDLAYGDNVYWRGRIWGPLNFWVYQGLRRAGRWAEAAALADTSRRLFAGGWAARKCGENYNAETGAIDDQPDTDGFYSWGALLPALTVSEHLDFTPWGGWSLQTPPPGARLGPLSTPLGRCFLAADESAWRLEQEDGRVLLESNFAGRITRLDLDGPQPEALLPPVEEDGAWIAFPAHAVSRCRLGDQLLDARDGRFALPRQAAPAPLVASSAE